MPTWGWGVVALVSFVALVAFLWGLLLKVRGILEGGVAFNLEDEFESPEAYRAWLAERGLTEED